MRNWLKDKYVIISGASGGIGREMTKLLVNRYDANVVGIGRSEEKMRSLQEDLGVRKEKFFYKIFDVSQKEEWSKFVEWLHVKHITPCLLINNAGIFPKFEKALHTDIDVFQRVMEVNYFSILYAVSTIKELLKGEGRDKPAIVNISSSAALCAIVGTSSYTASKSAVKGYTEALQMEENGETYVGIIYPGTTKSDLFREDKNTENSALDIIAIPTEKMAKKIIKAILRKRKRAVLGWDAKLMSFTAKIAPVKGIFLIRKVMQLSRSKVFSNIFNDKRK